MCFDSWACKSRPSLRNSQHGSHQSQMWKQITLQHLSICQANCIEMWGEVKACKHEKTRDMADNASYSDVERWLCGRDWQIAQGSMELDLKDVKNQFQIFKHTMGLSVNNVAACSLQRTNSWAALLVVPRHDTLFRWQNSCTSRDDSCEMCKHYLASAIKNIGQIFFQLNLFNASNGRPQKLPNETLNTPVYQNSSIHGSLYHG